MQVESILYVSSNVLIMHKLNIDYLEKKSGIIDLFSSTLRAFSHIHKEIAFVHWLVFDLVAFCLLPFAPAKEEQPLRVLKALFCAVCYHDGCFYMLRYTCVCGRHAWPHTFARYYSLDVTNASFAHVVLSTARHWYFLAQYIPSKHRKWPWCLYATSSLVWWVAHVNVLILTSKDDGLCCRMSKSSATTQVWQVKKKSSD